MRLFYYPENIVIADIELNVISEPTSENLKIELTDELIEFYPTIYQVKVWVSSTDYLQMEMIWASPIGAFINDGGDTHYVDASNPKQAVRKFFNE
jgi:hypothetical protein